jgi:hypothetical protein
MSTEQLLLDTQAAAAAIAASRLLGSGAARNQRATFLFLVITTISCFVLSLFDLGSRSYFFWYLGCLAVTDLVAAGAVAEIFSLSVADYPGIRTVGRWCIYSALGISIAASSAISVVLWNSGPHKGTWFVLYLVLNIHRAVQIALTAAVLSLLFLLSRYPLELSGNLHVSGFLFSAALLVDAADALVATFSPRLFSWWADMASVLLQASCYICWAWLIRREPAPPRRITFRTSQDSELIQQLENLNRTLSGVGRR